MVATDILDFQNFNFSTVRTVNRVDRTASLCQISSKSLELRPRYGDIFRCFKMVAAAILDFKNFRFLTVGTVKKVELHQCAKCHRNRSNRGRDMWDYEFATLTWKCLFTPLLGFFWGGTFPQMSLIVITPKRTILGLNHVIWAINREYFPIYFWMGLTRVLYFHWFNITGPTEMGFGGF